MASRPRPENGYPQPVEPARAAPPVPPRRAKHDPEDHAEQMAQLFAQVLPTLLHATARVTPDQRVFLEHLAERKGQRPALAPLIAATLTETEALFLRRVLIGMPDAEAQP